MTFRWGDTSASSGVIVPRRHVFRDPGVVFGNLLGSLPSAQEVAAAVAHLRDEEIVVPHDRSGEGGPHPAATRDRPRDVDHVGVRRLDCSHEPTLPRRRRNPRSRCG